MRALYTAPPCSAKACRFWYMPWYTDSQPRHTISPPREVEVHDDVRSTPAAVRMRPQRRPTRADAVTAGAFEPPDGPLPPRNGWRVANEEALAPVEPLPGYRQYVGEPPGLDHTDCRRRVSAASWQREGSSLPDLPLSVIQDAKRLQRRTDRYRRKRRLQALDWQQHAVRLCGRRRKGMQAGIGRTVSGHRAVWSGLIACRNYVACPTCRAQVAGKYRDQLRRLHGAITDRGGQSLLITETTRHRGVNDLATMRAVLSEARKHMYSGREWKSRAAELGYVGMVRVVETTWGPDNGFHPHSHAMVFLSKRVTEEQLTQFWMWAAVRWVQAVLRANERVVGASYGLPTVDRGWSITATGGMELYITKMGIGDGGVGRAAMKEAEIADQEDKQAAPGRYSLDELESMYVTYAETGCEIDARAVYKVLREYVEGMRGFHPFHITPRLAERIAALPLLPGLPECLATDPIGSPERDAVEHVYTFDTDEWYRLRLTGPYALARVEDIVESGGGAAELRGFLADLITRRIMPTSLDRPELAWTDVRAGEDTDRLRIVDEPEDNLDAA